MPPQRRRLRRRHNRRVLEDDEEWECPYERCKLRCPSEWAHCRRMAFLRYKYAKPAVEAEEKEEEDEDDDGGEPDVQRYVGVYVDANGEVVPISLTDALRAVAEGE